VLFYFKLNNKTTKTNLCCDLLKIHILSENIEQLSKDNNCLSSIRERLAVSRDVLIFPFRIIPVKGPCELLAAIFLIYFSERASSYNSGKWPNWRTISSIICFFESSTCFEQLCALLQEDNCINTTSGIITLCQWSSGRPLTHSDYIRSCINP